MLFTQPLFRILKITALGREQSSLQADCLFVVVVFPENKTIRIYPDVLCF